MTNKYAIILALALALTLGACSSSKKSDGEGSTDEIPPAADANTDAVPPAAEDGTQASASVDAPPGDPLAMPTEAAPADPSAAPTDMASTDVPPPPADQSMAQPSDMPPPADMMASADPQPQDPAAPVTATGEMGDYTVASGDTLMKIAFETYGDLYQWKKIYDANRDKLSSPSALSRGMVLKLEKPAVPVVIDRNGEKYLIKLGDTLGKISDDVYGSPKKWKKIWENNKQMIRDPNRIFAGFYLYYTMTPDDQREADELKRGRVVPTPLAAGAPADDRVPAGTPAGQ